MKHSLLLLLCILIIQGCFVPLRQSEKPYEYLNVTNENKTKGPDVLILKTGAIFKSTWGYNNKYISDRSARIYLTHLSKLKKYKNNTWGHMFFP